MPITKEEFKRLSNHDKRLEVAKELKANRTVREIADKLGASHNLIDKVKRWQKQEEASNKDKENKAIEVSQALETLNKVEEIDKKTEQAEKILERLENADNDLDLKINNIIHLKHEILEDILKNIKMKVKDKENLNDYEQKIITEMIKQS
ncbi:MAG: hypothetical protein FWE18_03695 [Alphaproteobacteria bacterium]|nr:hypothetical protein [Alphaproteobacteria bacterium]